MKVLALGRPVVVVPLIFYLDDTVATNAYGLQLRASGLISIAKTCVAAVRLW